MKTKYFSLIVLGLIALCLVYLVKFTFKKKESEEKTESHLAVYSEKQFAIVIASYNNERYCLKNIHSVLEQTYPNYRVIYIDDHSTDTTYEKVKNLIDSSGKIEHFTLIENEERLGALANIYKAVHLCKDDEIVVILDGDDFLAHEGVLAYLNEVYQDPDVWVTYGNYLDYPCYSSKASFCKKIPKKVKETKSYRKFEWVTSHLKTFYASLFKQVRIEDLVYKGKFFSMAQDLSWMFPLLEMAGDHVHFIKKILYLYNRQNPISDHQVDFNFQQECGNEIRSRSKYPTLATLPHLSSVEKLPKEADLIIFSYNRPMQLYALLESSSLHITGLNKVFVLYRASSQEFVDAYDEVKKAFPKVHFVAQSSHAQEDFQPLLSKILLEGSSPYVIFSVDDIIVRKDIDLTNCVDALEKTKAWGFFLGQGKNLKRCYMLDCIQPVPPLISIQEDIFAWQFKEGIGDWNWPNSLDMVVYPKEVMQRDFAKLTFHHPNDLENQWLKKAKLKRIGLTFSESAIVNLPLNLVNISSNRYMNRYSPEQLLQKFQEGLKIDIAPLSEFAPISRHIDYEPCFIHK